MVNTYKTVGHAKFLMQAHLVLVCKYRRHLVSATNISNDIKKLSKEIAERHNVIIRYIETDKDHIHYLEVNYMSDIQKMRKQMGLSQSQFANKFNIKLKNFTALGIKP